MYNDLDFEEVTPNEVEDIPVSTLDNALIAVKESVAEYDRLKKISTEAYHVAETNKQTLMALLKRANKKQWRVEGAGGFTMYDELKFKVPSDLAAKHLFFQFLGSPEVSRLLRQNSQDILLAHTTVHSATLNSFCKNIKKIAAEEGNDIQLPGIEAPKAESKLRSLK